MACGDAIIQAGRGAEPDRIIVSVSGMVMPSAAAAEQTTGKGISGMGAFVGGGHGSGSLSLLKQLAGNNGRMVVADHVLGTVSVIPFDVVADVVGCVRFLEERIPGVTFRPKDPPDHLSGPAAGRPCTRAVPRQSSGMGWGRNMADV